MKGQALTIGKAAALAGVGTKAIRFYESVGVIPAPARAENGYRLYAAEVVDFLRFVRQAQGLGLTLGEIREIVTIRQGGRPPCRHVHRLLEEKDRKLSDLLMLRRRIRHSLAGWHRVPAGRAVVCPHIESRAAQPRRGRA